jgi:hypothetical protein
MNLKNFLISFVTTLVLTLVVAAIVSFLYSLVVHGTGVVDWELSFRMGIILGIILPSVKMLENRKKGKTV